MASGLAKLSCLTQSGGARPLRAAWRVWVRQQKHVGAGRFYTRELRRGTTVNTGENTHLCSAVFFLSSSPLLSTCLSSSSPLGGGRCGGQRQIRKRDSSKRYEPDPGWIYSKVIRVTWFLNFTNDPINRRNFLSLLWERSVWLLTFPQDSSPMTMSHPIQWKKSNFGSDHFPEASHTGASQLIRICIFLKLIS